MSLRISAFPYCCGANTIGNFSRDLTYKQLKAVEDSTLGAVFAILPERLEYDKARQILTKAKWRRLCSFGNPLHRGNKLVLWGKVLNKPRGKR